jgi:hypothetical protein
MSNEKAKLIRTHSLSTLALSGSTSLESLATMSELDNPMRSASKLYLNNTLQQIFQQQISLFNNERFK